MGYNFVMTRFVVLAAVGVATGCADSPVVSGGPDTTGEARNPGSAPAASGEQDGASGELARESGSSLLPASDGLLADVLSVEVSGASGTFTFAVRLRSPDTGCDQFADFWEVLSAEGELLYRRILAHSHVDEQPFTRTGGPVPVAPEDIVLVRAHMRPGGYGGRVMRGSAVGGFEPAASQPDFALEVLQEPPSPGDCAF